MLRFKIFSTAWEWVTKFAQGDVCVIHSNARLLFRHSGAGFLPGDMRVLEIEVAPGVWD